MAKNVLRYNEFVNSLDKVVSIKPPLSSQLKVQDDEFEKEEQYTGPTVEDLKREAEEFKAQWEAEKNLMIQEAQNEVQGIIEGAQATAFDIVKAEKDNAARIKMDAERAAQEILDQARQDAAKMEAQTKASLQTLESEARKKGQEEGYKTGFASGESEVQRLVGRIHTIIEKIIEKRGEIIEGTETQIVNLVLMISKKVIKVISENQRNVVVNNVLQALRKLKTRGDVVVRVNLEDLKVASDHVKEFLRLVENVKSITVMEDSTVDLGGCVVDTDFGEIDARIGSQLHEIEEKILQMMPIRSNVMSGSVLQPEEPPASS